MKNDTQAKLVIGLVITLIVSLENASVIAQEKRAPATRAKGTFRRVTFASVAKQWKSLPAMPAPLQEIYPARVGHRIVVAGGFGVPKKGPHIENRCFIFDGVTKTWNRGRICPPGGITFTSSIVAQRCLPWAGMN